MDTIKVQQVNWRVLLGFIIEIWVRSSLQEQKWFKDNCITKAQPNMGDNSQNLGNWRMMHSLEVDQQD